MTGTPRDTGDLLEVPEEQRLNVDDGDLADYAGDKPDLGDVYANPGGLVEEDLG